MDYAELRKLSLKLFICFLALTALIAIITVLGGEFGELQMKILATTFTISAASICSMCCAAFIEKRKMIKLGLAGIFLSVIGAGLLIIGLWLEIKSDEYVKTTITVIVAALACAHAFLLMLPDLEDRQKWVQKAAMGAIGILAVQIIIAIWGEIESEGYYRFLAVVAIIAGLATLVIPILTKFRKGNGIKSELLILENVEGEMFKDAAGNMYSVKEINSEQSAPTE